MLDMSENISCIDERLLYTDIWFIFYRNILGLWRQNRRRRQRQWTQFIVNMTFHIVFSYCLYKIKLTEHKKLYVLKKKGRPSLVNAVYLVISHEF